MHLISRVNRSGMIAARSHIVSPVMQSLLMFAALAFIGTGIAGYIADGDVEQFVVVLVAAVIIIGEYIGVPYVVALGRLECLQMFYDTKVLNFHVHFDNEAMRIVGISGDDIGQIEYDEITKYVESNDSIFLIAGFHVFIFDRESAENIGLRQHLLDHGVKMGKRKS